MPVDSPELACVVLAHSDPAQVHRLIEALDPFPVFLHVDANTAEPVFDAIVRDLPERVTILRRIPTPWATWGAVEAEIEGYRAALGVPGITHVALVSGADYPIAPIDDIRRMLREHPGDSFGATSPLPYSEWGHSGGFDRLRYRHWARGKRMLRLPIPRSLPKGVDFAGGATSKILAVDHARALVATYDARPDLVAFWRRSWSADETFVNSILNTPAFVPGWRDAHVNTPLWWIDWGGPRKKSPPWLTLVDLPRLETRHVDDAQLVPCTFARKFSTQASTDLMDALDAKLGLRPGAAAR
ncbi:beta-1,6-N-acetylglucosaminyltransferase [Frondihabitans australicus]|uniref:Peptide O-xylosyltransferase n=1 Tax=Frondihabitans australicus TaxID=386892 RepID=A0A495IG53_9MICO|nr:beta-1,6-N-acetylglucosaminyltransferase [Frondihabitans australicus]RKR74914.1 core-2/I-Branching enzyme [Frondihabitans australicus]